MGDTSADGCVGRATGCVGSAGGMSAADGVALELVAVVPVAVVVFGGMSYFWT